MWVRDLGIFYCILLYTFKSKLKTIVIFVANIMIFFLCRVAHFEFSLLHS